MFSFMPLGMEKGLDSVPLRPWLLVLPPAVGGLAVGWLCSRFSPRASGGGTDDVVNSFHRGEAQMDGKIIPVKLLASALTIGSGGSGGTEGPIIQIGATTGSWISEKLQLQTEERRLLFIAGAAGGVGSIFRAPLGGALFACEMFYSRPELETDAVVSSLVASVTAYAVFGLFRGFEPLFNVDSALKLDLATFFTLTLLAISTALAARTYGFLLERLGSRLEKFPLFWRPALGGLLVGGTGLLVWAIATHLGETLNPALSLGSLGEGYGVLRLASFGTLPLTLLALVFTGKLLSSSLSIASGGSAGTFAPSMVLGGCLGAIAWKIMMILGFTEVPPAAFVLAGMSGFFASAFRCPLSSVVIIIEVAQGYHLLPALMWVAALGYLLGPDPGLIRGQLRSRGESPAHRGELSSAALMRCTVGQAMRDLTQLTSFSPETPVKEIREAIGLTRQEFFPVLDATGTYRGGFFWTAAAAANPQGSAASLVAVDIPLLQASETLDAALSRLIEAKADELPVTDNAQRLVGLINRRELWSRAMEG